MTQDQINLLDCFEYGLEHVNTLKERFVNKCRGYNKRQCIEKFFHVRDQLYSLGVIDQPDFDAIAELKIPWKNVPLRCIRNPNYDI